MFIKNIYLIVSTRKHMKSFVWFSEIDEFENEPLILKFLIDTNLLWLLMTILYTPSKIIITWLINKGKYSLIFEISLFRKRGLQDFINILPSFIVLTVFTIILSSLHLPSLLNGIIITVFGIVWFIGRIFQFIRPHEMIGVNDIKNPMNICKVIHGYVEVGSMYRSKAMIGLLTSNTLINTVKKIPRSYVSGEEIERFVNIINVMKMFIEEVKRNSIKNPIEICKAIHYHVCKLII